jgi:hypothetical protein
MKRVEVIGVDATIEAGTPEELDRALAARVGDGNHFMIVAVGDRYPMLDVMVAGRYAAVHFFAEEGGGSDQAASNLEDAPDEVHFPHSAMGDVLTMPGDVLIDVSTANRCVHEFAATLRRPTAVGWIEL